jgi:hypothetical protein
MRPFYNEADVEIADKEVLHLVLDFRAIDVIESLTGQSMDDVIPQLSNPPHNLAAKMLWAMLREKHEGVSLNEAMGVVVDRKYGPRVGLAMGDLLRRAYDLGEEKDENPPKRRGRSTSSEKSG